MPALLMDHVLHGGGAAVLVNTCLWGDFLHSQNRHGASVYKSDADAMNIHWICCAKILIKKKHACHTCDLISCFYDKVRTPRFKQSINDKL